MNRDEKLKAMAEKVKIADKLRLINMDIESIKKHKDSLHELILKNYGGNYICMISYELTNEERQELNMLILNYLKKLTKQHEDRLLK